MEPVGDPAAGVFAIRVDGARLEQRVTLSATTLRTGDTLWIESELENVGDGAVTVTHTICGLLLRTEMEWHDPFAHCLALAGPHEMAPGDTARDLVGLVIDSPPGNYELEIQHVVAPEVWVPRTVVVTGP